MELRIKKATHHIQRIYPWIDRADVLEIITELESSLKDEAQKNGGKFHKMGTQEIIELVYDICRDV